MVRKVFHKHWTENERGIAFIGLMLAYSHRRESLRSLLAIRGSFMRMPTRQQVTRGCEHAVAIFV